MRCWCLLLLPLVFPLPFVPPAIAGPNAHAKVVLHLVPVAGSNPCSRTEARPKCSQIVTAGKLAPNFYDLFVLVTDGNAGEGISAVLFGVNWDDGNGLRSGIDLFSWTLCASSEASFPQVSWPGQAPDVSNSVSWNSSDACQQDEPGGLGTGVVAVVGYFVVGAYAPGTMRVSPINRRSGKEFIAGQVRVTSCHSQVDVLEDAYAPHSPGQLGSVTFSADGMSPGYNPCSAVMPVVGETWSRIKGRLVFE